MTPSKYGVLSEGGCEQYIEMSVTVSRQHVDLHSLDPNGNRQFRRYVAGRPFACFGGTMIARWKGSAEREKCKQERIPNGRWRDVEGYKAAMMAGDTFPPGVLLHPSITGRLDGLLVPIDGARRLMASLEAGLVSIPVVVVFLQANQENDIAGRDPRSGQRTS